MRQLPAVALLNHHAETPVVLAGTPDRLTGHVHLHNPTAQRVVLRQARLRNMPVSQRNLRAHPDEAPRELAVPLPALLAPDQRGRVRVRIAIDPYTPPGNYEAELSLGEHSHPVRLLVAERLSIGVAPEVVMIENRPGGRVRRHIALTNHGNVPLEIGNIGAVVLDEELLACKTIRAMLADDDARSLGDWVSAYLREGKRQLDSIGMLWVDIVGAPHTLPPGETRAVELAVRVPDSLDRRSRYHGVAFLYDADISFTVAPTGTVKGAAEDPPGPDGAAGQPPAPRKQERSSKR